MLSTEHQDVLQFYLKAAACLSAMSQLYRAATPPPAPVTEPWDNDLFGVPATEKASAQGLGLLELAMQIVMTTQFSTVPPSATLQARIHRSLVADWFFDHYTAPLVLEYACGSTTLQERVPIWAVQRAVYTVCVPDGVGDGEAAAVYTPPLFGDMLWQLLGRSQSPNVPAGKSQPPAGASSVVAGPAVHGLQSTILHVLSLMAQEWRQTLGKALTTAVALSFFQYSVYQLRSAGRLPDITPDLLNTSHPSVASYYGLLCEHTLVGRLLVLCGVEPQLLIAEQTTTSLWPMTREERKKLKCPAMAQRVLDEYFGLKYAPYTDRGFPLNATCFEILSDAFWLLFDQLPRLWPMDRVITSQAAASAAPQNSCNT